MTVEKW